MLAPDRLEEALHTYSAIQSSSSPSSHSHELALLLQHNPARLAVFTTAPPEPFTGLVTAHDILEHNISRR
jgi:hypothetical protein